MNKHKTITLLILLFLTSFFLFKENKKNAYPIEFEIKNFKSFKQPDGFSCGPTSIQMVLNYYKNPQKLSDIRREAKTDLYSSGDFKIGGTTPKYMEIALERFKIKAKIKTGDLEELKAQVSKSKPICVLVRSGMQYWHWFVVTGYDEKFIIVHDPASGRRDRIPNEIFESAWSFYGDLDGNDMTAGCFFCDGDGQLIPAISPLGKCDFCSGSGKLPDVWYFLVKMGEATGNIMVIPK